MTLTISAIYDLPACIDGGDRAVVPRYLKHRGTQRRCVGGELRSRAGIPHQCRAGHPVVYRHALPTILM
jgi:hypothetical protein